MKADRVMVVDDEEVICHVVGGLLEEEGLQVQRAASAEEALAQMRKSPPDLAIVDIVLPGMNGLELLKRIRQIAIDTEVVMMTSHASVETAIEAIREGAYDYLQKPFQDLDDVLVTVERALQKRRLDLENRSLLRAQEQRNQELSAAVMRLSSMVVAGRAMSECDSLPQLLDFFVGLVADELEVDRASLMLVCEESQELRIVASRGLEEFDVDGVRVPLGKGLAGLVAKSGEPLLVKNTDNDPRVGSLAREDLSDSFMCTPIMLSIPIKSRETVLGVINVTNRRSEIPFSNDDLSYLSGLAGQLAVAIDRGRHVDDLTAAYESLKVTQEQLVRSERIKTVGQMAAGVAHDFNNALGVIQGKAELALMRAERGRTELDALRSDLETILKVVAQGAATVRRIQDYTGIRKDEPGSIVGLNGVVRDAVEITRPKWHKEQARRSPIEVRVESGNPPAVSADPQELCQVVCNLIFNAVEAMPDGGQIDIRTGERDDSAFLEIADSGGGMSPETLKRLFEPFYTTKQHGQGLGMSIVRGIVKRHSGRIEVASAEGEGTMFTLQFPGAVGVVEQPEPDTDRGRHNDQAFRVLLVDDEDGIRNTFAEALSEAGHEVVTAESGERGLALLERELIDVVVTDLGMPGMTGLELGEQIRERGLDLPVILMSGWATQQDSEEARRSGVDVVLSKPCSLGTLLNSIRSALRN